MSRLSCLLWPNGYHITDRFGGVHGTPESIDVKGGSEERRGARQLQHDSVLAYLTSTSNLHSYTV